jgi:hypothetical protein
MREVALACALVFAAHVSFSAETVVRGIVPQWAEKQGVAFFLEDEYTLRPIEVGTFMADSQGKFEVRVGSDFTRVLILRCGYTNLRFFIKPGRSYSIRLGEEELPMRSLVTNVYAYPVFDMLESEDPNARIGWFNEQYDAFFAENAWLIAQSEYAPGTGYRRSNPEKLKQFGLSEDEDSVLFRREKPFGELALEFTRFIDESSVAWNDPFCRTYCLSVCAEMLLSAGIKPGYILGEILQGVEPDLRNPGYTQFVSRCFNSPEGIMFSDTLRMAADWICSGMNATDFADRISSCCGDINVTLSGHVVFFNLLGMRRRGLADQSCLKEFAIQIDKASGDLGLQVLLERIDSADRKLAPGEEFYDIRSITSDLKKTQLSDYRGQLVCLSFFTTWNAQSLEELAFLDGISKKYRRELKVVAISLDERFVDFRDYVASHHKYHMDFRYGFGDFFIRENTGVFSVPHFILVSPAGRVLQGQGKLPSRGLEEQIQKAIGIKPEERLKVWDD